MDINSIKRDSASIEAGQWIGDIPGFGDVRFKVRGLTSPTAVALRSRKERKVPIEDRERDGSLKPQVAIRLMGEILHEACLLDWDGITSNGQPVPYDSEQAKAWLTDPDFMSFADAVAYAAGVVDRTRAGQTGALSKNSAAPSRGK